MPRAISIWAISYFDLSDPRMDVVESGQLNGDNVNKFEAHAYNVRMDKKIVIENWPYFLSKPIDFI